jgi:Flp pilus assembly protein TadB
VGDVIAAAALCGVLVGLGALVFVTGVRGTDRARLPRLPSRARVEGGSNRLAMALVAAAVVGALTRWPVGAALAAAFGFASPAFFGGARSRRSAVARTEAIAAWAEMLRDTMAAAAGIEQAIVSTAPVAPPAIRREVMVLATRLERDRLGPALRRFAEELADPTGDLVVAALVLASEKQAQRLGELLGALASSARQQATMRLRVDAGRARTRTASRVITVFTLGFALGLVVLNRGYLTPYDGLRGQLVLAVVGVCFGAAFWWLSAMARVDAPERFLVQRSEQAP